MESSEKRREILFRNTKETVAIVSSAASLLLVILWLTGRSFAAGYFEALNIPPYYVQFSTWEYAEVSWRYFFVFLLFLVLIGGFFIGVANIILSIASFLWSEIQDWLLGQKKEDNKKESKFWQKIKLDVKEAVRLILLAVIIFSFGFMAILLVESSMLFAKDFGKLSGQIAMQTTTKQISLVSNMRLDLEGQQKIEENEATTFLYAQYRLLSYNHGKYFIFREIDLDTCKPTEVFVVLEENIIQVDFHSNELADFECIPDTSTLEFFDVVLNKNQGNNKFVIHLTPNLAGEKMEIAELVLDYISVLIWPFVTLILVFSFRYQLRRIFSTLRKADLPGGVSLAFSEDLEEAQKLSSKIEAAPPPEDKKDIPSIPLTEANKRMIDLGLRPSPSGLDINYYRQISYNDPNLALAGLRIELDVLAKNLAKGFRVETSSRDTLMNILSKLLAENSITNEQMELAQKVYRLTSKAVHGEFITMPAANSVLDVAEVLIDQYLIWLSWGFDDEWEPNP